MQNDQTPSVDVDGGSPDQPSSEVLAVLGQSQPDVETESEEVTPEAETGKQTDDDTEEEDQPTDEETEEESEEEGDEPDSEEDTEEEPEEEVNKFVIAGQEYEGMDAATKAINRISGDNTRLAGENKSLNSRLAEQEDTISTLTAKVKEWQEYFDAGEGNGEEPEKLDVEEKVRKIIQEERERDAKEAIKAQYRTELDEIEEYSDYTVVLPHMLKLAEDLGDAVQSISPKKLFNMARGIANGGKASEVLETAEKMAEEKSTKTRAKSKAKKVVGGNAKKSPSIAKESISPEVAAILA